MNSRIAHIVTEANVVGLRLLLRVCTPLRPVCVSVGGNIDEDAAPTSPSADNGDNVLFLDEQQVDRIIQIAVFFQLIRVERTYLSISIYHEDQCLASVTTRPNRGGASIADLNRDISRMFLKTSYGVRSVARSQVIRTAFSKRSSPA